MKKEDILSIIILLSLFIFLFYVEVKISNLTVKHTYFKNELSKKESLDKNEVIISFIGDCTLGTGLNYSYTRSFIEKYNNIKDDSYFFGGVKDILSNDNFTVANLEGVLSDTASTINPKKYNYKGPSKYANILKKGSVEMVNLANNHTYDYLEKGYNDTINSLNNKGILHFGYNNYQIVETNNIKIGLFGLGGWDYSSTKKEIDIAINKLKDTDIIIANFHWGEMRKYTHTKTQEQIAKYAIDKGVDLVIGHHSHVLGGIEKYKDKYIAYSLGNFVYGGIYYPYDSDTMILRMHYKLKDNKIESNYIEIIPCSITSSKIINDYRPIPSKEKQRIINKINKYSTNFIYENR